MKQEQFIEKAKYVWGDKYNYSKVKYINNYTKVCIICPEHGEFWQIPKHHLKKQYACYGCKGKCCNTKEWIEKAKAVHGDKYDYSKVEYINANTKVCIICSEHGEFWQTPSAHLQGQGCKKCSFKLFTKTTEDFIKEAKEIHGDKYDYSKVKYKNALTKVCIICPEHGEFWQKPNDHLNNNGCPVCNGGIRYTTEQFIQEAKAVHGDKYDYSKVEYVNCKTKVCIICPEHGEFWQTPSAHLQGQGCKKCYGNETKTTETFIQDAIKVHGDKYDYSKVEYVNNYTKVCIICHEKDELGNEHGEFWQKPNEHLQNHGCKKCQLKNAFNNYGKTKEEFVAKAKNVHLNKYDYSESVYNGVKEKIWIICPEHGGFWQMPSYHLSGCGCPECGNKCNVSERKLYNIIKNTFNNEEVIYQYRDKHKFGLYSFDIYLPLRKIAIEYQGEQHFRPIKRFGGYKKYITQIERDKNKLNLADSYGIKIYYFNFDHKVIDKNYMQDVITDIQLLINKINENEK